MAHGGLPVGLTEPAAPDGRRTAHDTSDAPPAASPSDTGVTAAAPPPTDRELERLADDASPFVRLAKVEDVFNLARANSLWPLTFGLAC